MGDFTRTGVVLMSWFDILKMGMDLESDKKVDFRWNIWGWRDILNTMKAFGWEPKGALSTTLDMDDDEEWDRDKDYERIVDEPERRIGYGSNDFQRVEWEDAQGMLEATNKLIEAVQNMKTFEASNLNRPSETKVIDMEEALQSDLGGAMSGAFKDMLREGVKIPEIQEWANDLDYLEEWKDYLQQVVNDRGWFAIG